MRNSQLKIMSVNDKDYYCDDLKFIEKPKMNRIVDILNLIEQPEKLRELFKITNNTVVYVEPANKRAKEMFQENYLKMKESILHQELFEAKSKMRFPTFTNKEAKIINLPNLKGDSNNFDKMKITDDILSGGGLKPFETQDFKFNEIKKLSKSKIEDKNIDSKTMNDNTNSFDVKKNENTNYSNLKEAKIINFSQLKYSNLRNINENLKVEVLNICFDNKPINFIENASHLGFHEKSIKAKPMTLFKLQRKEIHIIQKIPQIEFRCNYISNPSSELTIHVNSTKFYNTNTKIFLQDQPKICLKNSNFYKNPLFITSTPSEYIFYLRTKSDLMVEMLKKNLRPSFFEIDKINAHIKGPIHHNTATIKLSKKDSTDDSSLKYKSGRKMKSISNIDPLKKKKKTLNLPILKEGMKNFFLIENCKELKKNSNELLISQIKILHYSSPFENSKLMSFHEKHTILHKPSIKNDLSNIIDEIHESILKDTNEFSEISREKIMSCPEIFLNWKILCQGPKRISLSLQYELKELEKYLEANYDINKLGDLVKNIDKKQKTDLIEFIRSTFHFYEKLKDLIEKIDFENKLLKKTLNYEDFEEYKQRVDSLRDSSAFLMKNFKRISKKLYSSCGSKINFEIAQKRNLLKFFTEKFRKNPFEILDSILNLTKNLQNAFPKIIETNEKIDMIRNFIRNKDYNGLKKASLFDNVKIKVNEEKKIIKNPKSVEKPSKYSSEMFVREMNNKNKLIEKLKQEEINLILKHKNRSQGKCAFVLMKIIIFFLLMLIFILAYFLLKRERKDSMITPIDYIENENPNEIFINFE